MKSWWLLILLLSLVAIPAVAAEPAQIGSLALRDLRAPSAIELSTDGATLYLGTVRSRKPELYVIDASIPEAPVIADLVEVGARVHDIVLGNGRIYLATGHPATELLILDAGTHAEAGRYDLPGRRAARSLELLENGNLRVGRKRGQGAQYFEIDVRDPHLPVLIGTSNSPNRIPRPTRASAPPSYREAGLVRARQDFPIPFGTRFFLVSRVRGRGLLQVVEQIAPVRFLDANGDGRFVLGCLGDSNTVASPSFKRWCDRLKERVNDSQFRIHNIAVSGATANSNLNPAQPGNDLPNQMAEIPSLRPALDAVVMSFGTNDIFQGRPPETVVDAYLAAAELAEARGLAVYVTTTPPLRGCLDAGCPGAEAQNALIRTAFPGQFIEFYDGIHEAQFADGIHFNADGQMLRMQRAFDMIAVEEAD